MRGSEPFGTTPAAEADPGFFGKIQAKLQDPEFLYSMLQNSLGGGGGGGEQQQQGAPAASSHPAFTSGQRIAPWEYPVGGFF